MRKFKKSILMTTIVAMFFSSVTFVHADSSVFGDITAKDWFFPYVEEMTRNEFMTGLSENEFGPYELVSRAQFVTVLYRMEGAAKSAYQAVFFDVPDGEWYTDAVTWAAENEIVSGYENGCFGPADAVTREQMAAMLYSYAKYKGFETNQWIDLTDYSDSMSISDFARTAFSWCVSKNIIRGDRDGNLNPASGATRAECAALLCRFAYFFDIGEKSGEYIVNYADQFVGNPYIWGGSSLFNGIDSSHFVYQILKNCGVYDGGYVTSKGWQEKGTAVSGLEEAQAGDVICYSGHVAIYDGHGGIVEAKGSKFGITHDRSAEYSTIIAIRRFVE